MRQRHRKSGTSRLFPEANGAAMQRFWNAVSPARPLLPHPRMIPPLDLRVPFIGMASGLALLAFARDESGIARPLDRPSAGSVAGVVLDAHGDPVPGALVLVVDEHGRAVAESETAVSFDDEASLGEFRIAGLAPGEYGLRAVVPESDAVAAIAHVPVRPWEDTRVRIRVDLGY